MRTKDVVLGAAMGLAGMFMLDPGTGRRRRALVRDKAVRATRKTKDGLDATARDMANRASGIVAATRRRWSRRPADDATLLERARAGLGRVSSHPHAIDIHVRDGHVVVRGPVLASEASGIVAAVAAIPGVKGVRDELEPHASAEGIPSLQGAGRRPGPSLDILQSRWAPATRAVVTAGLVATGVALAVAGMRTPHAA